MKITVDEGRREIYLGSKPAEFQPREFQVLLALGRAGGNVVTRGELLKACGAQSNNPRSIDQYVSRIRRRAGRNSIRTVTHDGYSAPSISVVGSSRSYGVIREIYPEDGTALVAFDATTIGSLERGRAVRTA